MKIAFVHDWDVNYQQELDWQDGLSAALRELENRNHEVVRFVSTNKNRSFIPNPIGQIIATPDIPADVKGMKPDVILQWADCTRPNALPLAKLGVPTALCFAGGEPLGANVELFDHIFAESEVYRKTFADAGYSTSIAFGTNTELFKPTQQTKTFDTIFPATFALWKRHELYAKAVSGLEALACGYMYQDHETECWQVCLDNGLTVLPHVSADVLHYLYASAKVCVIPSLSSGGSQRTVLEAMAMNLPLVVCDSDKFDYVKGLEQVEIAEPTIESIRESIDYQLLQESINTRNYVLEHWSEYTYADSLLAGLESIL